MSRQRFDASRVFGALGDPTRRAMVERLSEHPWSLSALAEPLGITVTAAGQHMQVLESSGLARSEKNGRVRTCSLDPAGLLILERWIRERRNLWERRLDNLAELLAEPDKRE